MHIGGRQISRDTPYPAWGPPKSGNLFLISPPLDDNLLAPLQVKHQNSTLILHAADHDFSFYCLTKLIVIL